MSIFSRCVLWTGIFLTISKTTEPHCDQPFQIKKGNINKRLLGYKLFERNVAGHHLCAYECMVLGACRSINFIGGNRTCEFNSEGSDTGDPLNFEESRGTIFSDITDWPRSMASGCAYNKCEQMQRCFPLGSNEHACVDITCAEPRNLKYAVVQSGSNFAGSVRTYLSTCPKDMVLSGDTRITCLLSGEWSSLAASCKGLSRLPTIGNDCGSIADCNETGAECIEGKCFCGGLYRYDTDVKDCIKAFDDFLTRKNSTPSRNADTQVKGKWFEVSHLNHSDTEGTIIVKIADKLRPKMELFGLKSPNGFALFYIIVASLFI